MDWFARVLVWRERGWIGYAVAILGGFVGILARFGLGKLLVGAPFITFIPGILMASLVGGLLPGLLAVVLSGLLADEYLIAPLGLDLLWPSGWIVLTAFFIIAGIMVALVDMAVLANGRLARSSQLLRENNETLEARITARTAALMQAEEQLRQSQKMEAVGQLTGGIAHDFNNLLTAISGSLELLQTRLRQGRTADLERYIAEAQGAARRAAALTHRLLAFSRRQALDPKPTDINRLVNGMEELIRRTVGPAIAVEVAASDGLWAAHVDPHQLEQALLNLCINGSDAMPQGGVLTVATANQTLDGGADGLAGLHPGEYVCLAVSDNGCGMTPEVIERAFEPFFTTKPIGQGTGLGLSMIYGFARQSGGQVRIESEIGSGTTVRILLPRHAGPVEVAEPPPALAETPRMGGGRTVLVVDDEPAVRMLVVEVLQELGYTALAAGAGPEALNILETATPIDLLVTDVGLPEMNGQQVAQAARALRPALKVLFMTGYAEHALLAQGPLEAGMQVLAKPFALDILAARIRDLIAA